MEIVEIENARFIEIGRMSGSIVLYNVKTKEVREQVPLTYACSSKLSVPIDVVPNNNEEKQHSNEPMIHNEPIIGEPQEVVL